MFKTLNRSWLIGLAGCFAIAAMCSAAEPMAGRWEGIIHIPDNELNVAIDLSPDSSGAWIGSIIIPGLNTKGLALKEIVVKGPDATFATTGAPGRSLDATFKAHLNGNGVLAGNFTQGGNTAPFELKQTGPAQVELPPRSTPIAKDVEGEWQGEFQLFGYPRKVSLKLTNNGKSGAAEFVVVGKRVNNLPVDLVTQEGKLVSVYSHDTGITFEGQFRQDSGEIRGTFSQGPIEVPLILHRKS
jgi:hypothetical protein